MSAADLLNTLIDAGVEVTTSGDDLRCRAPVGVLTKDLAARIRDHKSGLIELLTVNRDPCPVPTAGLDWPPPPDVTDEDVLRDCRRWLADGTVARFCREKGQQVRVPGNPAGIRVSHGIWVDRGTEFVRRCLALIDEGHEGPRTRQRLRIYYWEIVRWLEVTP